MTVAFVVFGDIESRSGGYLYDRYLAGALREAGHRVVVVSQRRPGGGRIFYPLERLSGYSRRVRRRLASIEPGLVIIDELNHAAALGLIPVLRRRVPGVPIVALIHHLRYDERESVWRSLSARFERKFLLRSDAWLCNSKTTLRRVGEFVSERDARERPVHVATPGREQRQAAGGDGSPDGAVYSAPGDGSPSDGAETRRRGICFVGNVIPRKNLHVLLDAVASLPEDLRQLDVYGSLDADRRYAREVNRIVRSRGLQNAVTLHGDSDGRMIAEAYRSRAILAVPSSYEGFGIVYLEAMTHGCIPIAGSDGGARDVITDGENGFLVSPGGITDLAERMERILRDPAVRKRMSEAALRRAAEFPTWSESMNGAVRFLERLCRTDNP